MTSALPHDLDPGGTASKPASVMLSTDELSLLNSEPISFLATVAIRAGGPHYLSFDMAESVVLAHGSSRRIEARDAEILCERMRSWGASARGSGLRD